MTTDPAQLEGVFQQIRVTRRAWESIQLRLAQTNLSLHAPTAEGYIRWIKESQEKICRLLQGIPPVVHIWAQRAHQESRRSGFMNSPRRPPAFGKPLV